MSSDETPKIEPTLIDAPSITPEAKPEAANSEAAEAPKLEAAPEVKVEPKPEPAKIEPKIEARAEAPTLPPAPQIEPPKAIILRRRQPWTEKTEAQPRSARFALLAACVAIAASLGAIGGSLGVANFGLMTVPKAAPIAVAKDPSDEIRALKDTVAQLRAHTKSLNDNLASLKTTVTTTTAVANQQNGKIAETLERIEKAQAEQKKLMASQAAPGDDRLDQQPGAEASSNNTNRAHGARRPAHHAEAADPAGLRPAPRLRRRRADRRPPRHYRGRSPASWRPASAASRRSSARTAAGSWSRRAG